MKSILTISSVGDVSFAGGFCNHPELFHSWIADDVKAFLDADVRIANMEYVCLPRGEQWPGGLCLAEPAESVEALKYAGFNVVTLGNNHILDFKNETGMLATMQCLDRAGIKYCGAGINVAEAGKPAIIEVRGMRIAIFSRLHDYSFVDVGPIIATDARPGVALLLLDELRGRIEEYKASGQADIVVLCLHWGMQNLYDHSHEVHRLGQRLIECGADLILGHHAHVVQGLAEFNGKYCLWGQGNFYFHPYPLEGQPNGILYGPEAKRTRIALASRFSFDAKRWGVELMATELSANNTVTRLDEGKEARLLKNIKGKWSRFRPFAYQMAWRQQILKAYFTGLLHNMKQRKIKSIMKRLSVGFFRLGLDMLKPRTLG